MRELFPGYYEPTDSDLFKMWHEGVFAFDASVLLHVYAYKEETRRAFFSVFERVKNRLWIPHQAALEFHRNRENAIDTRGQFYKALTNILDAAQQSLKATLNNHKNNESFIGIDIDEVVNATTSGIEKAKEIVKEGTPDFQIKELRATDFIRDKLFQYLKDNVGSANVTLETIYEVAERRFRDKIPPGYAEDKLDFKKYGDIVLWYQLLEYAGTANKPLLFITDDTKKGDWWCLNSKNEPISPRPELIQEMFDKIGVTFYMYTGDQFLKTAKRFFPELQIDESVIDEAREVRVQAEKTEEQLLTGHVTIESGHLLYGGQSRVNIQGQDGFSLVFHDSDDVWRLAPHRRPNCHPTVLASGKAGYIVDISMSLPFMHGSSQSVSYKGIGTNRFRPSLKLNGSLELSGPLSSSVNQEFTIRTPFTATGSVVAYIPDVLPVVGDTGRLFEVTFEGSGEAEIIFYARNTSSTGHPVIRQITYLFS